VECEWRGFKSCRYFLSSFGEKGSARFVVRWRLSKISDVRITWGMEEIVMFNRIENIYLPRWSHHLHQPPELVLHNNQHDPNIARVDRGPLGAIHKSCFWGKQSAPHTLSPTLCITNFVQGEKVALGNLKATYLYSAQDFQKQGEWNRF